MEKPNVYLTEKKSSYNIVVKIYDLFGDNYQDIYFL